jgi:hypothetical protein
MGAAGGIVGGFSAFPGSIPVVHLGLRGVSKTQTPNITQLLHSGLATDFAEYPGTHPSRRLQYAVLVALALTPPAVLLGTSTGVALYRQLSEVNFRRAVLILLMVSGVSMIAKALI